MSRVAVLQLAGAVALLGASWPVTRYALMQGAAGSWFAFGRAGLSTLASVAVLAAFGRLRWPGRRDMPALLALGLLQLAAFFALAHAALAFVPAGRTAILSNATLIPAVPLSVLVLREAIPPRRWAAAGLGLGGVVVLTGPWAIDWTAPGMLWGHALLLLAATCWAAAMIVVRRWPPALSMLALLPWAFGLAGMALLPLALSHGAGVWTAPSVAALLGIGLVAAPAGTWCVMQAQRSLPVVVASVGFLAAPVLGVMVSAAWLHEPVTVDVLAGAGLVLGGALMAVLPGRSA